IQTVTAEHYSGNSALQIQIDGRDEIDTTKAAYKASIDSVTSYDKFSPRVLEPADFYHGFAMKIDPSYYKLPATGDLLFEQWWQGSPYHPPVSLVIVSPADCAAHGWNNTGRNGNFALILRDDEHDALSTTPGESQYFNLGPVVTGQWMRWLVHVRPSAATAEGAITITLNDQEELKLEHVKVGYNPDNPQYNDHKPSRHIAGVNVCLYRMNGQSFQRFFFDEIKFADRYEDAATPAQP
ncbi:MAG TPA: heparin lyase I family protein, partial [Pirellulales bacterium]|nr:heparin lyase I family protein [Pirellulales bacterium]